MHYELGKQKYGFYFGLLIAVLLITSCKNDNVDPTLEKWKQQNEKAFNDLAFNPDYTELRMPGSAASIYYRVLQKGNGKRTYYNGQAEVYYKGWFVATKEDGTFTAGQILDQRLFDDGVTYKIAIATDVIEGWRIALQYMVEGDKWEICIPYRLAYGEGGKVEQGIVLVPGYSTLAFEIELIKAIDPD